MGFYGFFMGKDGFLMGFRWAPENQVLYIYGFLAGRSRVFDGVLRDFDGVPTVFDSKPCFSPPGIHRG